MGSKVPQQWTDLARVYLLWPPHRRSRPQSLCMTREVSHPTTNDCEPGKAQRPNLCTQSMEAPNRGISALTALWGH